MERHRIESPKNPRVKEIARLRERRERERAGLFLIEGVREVERALSAGVLLSELLLSPQLARNQGLSLASRAESAGLKVVELAEEPFRRVSMRENPDGVIAVAPTWRLDPSELKLPAEPLLLVLDGLEKPGNLGALLRTADSVDADAVLISGAGTDVFNPNVVRASMGSVFSRPVVTAEATELRDLLRSWGVKTVATSPNAETAFWDADLTGSRAIVMGTEHGGLGEEWLHSADVRVRIPMSGMADSLNVATAGALMLFEAVRQRRLHRAE